MVQFSCLNNYLQFWSCSDQIRVDKEAQATASTLITQLPITDLIPFSDGLRDVAMATNFEVKIGNIGLFTYIRSNCISKQTTMNNVATVYFF